jgi:hypothetical protein
MSVFDTNAQSESVALDQFIARVLRRAHQSAEAGHGPDEARAILHVAQLFADDLAEKDPHFDRVGFIHAATRDAAHEQPYAGAKVTT